MFYVLALRDNRIELVRASWKELTISISDVTLSDEGQYTCSLFTMPVKTTKAFLTVLGKTSHRSVSLSSSSICAYKVFQRKPEITGSRDLPRGGGRHTDTAPHLAANRTADIRWFRNDKEVQVCKWYMLDRFSCDYVLAGQKEVNAIGRSFSVRSTIHLKVDRTDDGAAYTCVVEHIALGSLPHQVTEVLEVHYPPQVEIVRSVVLPQEGQYFKLECVSKGNPLPEPVLWTKDGGELPDVERMIVEGRDLIITTLNKTDNGTYRCEASNNLGTNRDEFTLYVYDPNALMQPGPDHALIGGVVAVVVFITLCFIIVVGRYLARHKGTYLTNEAKGAEDAPDADTAIINAEGNHAHAEEKKEYFI
ncbi:hypothetical protein cypCar_00020235 [Cyprinus carpio]|nr:hypothetical protein cypCar_00020235 [Cyprinus carpio]